MPEMLQGGGGGAHPVAALHLLVVRGSHVAGDAGGRGVQHDQRREQAAAVVRREVAHARQRKDGNRQRQQLEPAAVALDFSSPTCSPGRSSLLQFAAMKS